MTAPTSSDVVQTFKSPSQFLEALLSGVGFLNRSEKHYPAGSNLYPRHCETMILYESNIRNCCFPDRERVSQDTFTRERKERCTRLLSLLENSSKDADIGNIASIDTKQHCKKLSVELSHIKSRFNVHRESRFEPTKF